MKIYYTCSTAEFKKYRNTYFGIRNYLIVQKHILTRDWLPHTEALILGGGKDVRNMKEIYKECMLAIKKADLVIIEDTVSNFSTGHQITRALQYRKPTLVLWQGKKHRQFNKMFIHGIDSDILEVAEYDERNLLTTIHAFIKKFENVHEKNRFHLVLNNVERMYLDWAQYTKNKSRTKVIRESLRQIIAEDKDYQKYLSEEGNIGKV